MLNLILSAGHGLGTSGKRCLKDIDPNETREWILNNRLCRMIEDKLSLYKDVSVTRVDDRTGKQDVSLNKRIEQTNSKGGENLFLLCVHHNASGVKGGSATASGVTVYRYGASVKTTHKELEKLYKSIIECNGLKGNRSTPLATASFVELSKTKCEAMYLENGFMDSWIDTPKILNKEFADKTAQGIVNYLVARFNLELREVKNNTPSKVDGVQVGAYSVFGNASVEAKKILSKLGKTTITYDGKLFRVFK